MLLCFYDHLTIEKANKGIISHITKCLMSNIKTGETIELSFVELEKPQAPAVRGTGFVKIMG